MIVDFDIFKEGEHKIAIRGLSLCHKEYLDDSYASTYDYYKYKYDESITIDLIYFNQYTGGSDSPIEQSIYEDIPDVKYYTIDHTCSFNDEYVFTAKQDGWFTISQYILPTDKWLVNVLAQKDGIEYLRNIIENQERDIYIFDTKNNIIQQITFKSSGSDELVFTPKDTLAVLEMNELLLGTIFKSTRNYVLMEYLWDCYIKNSRNVINGMAALSCNKTDIDTFPRDFVWMTLNVLKYHAERCQFAEAARLIEELRTCNGFCNDETSSVSNTCGCCNR
jgi:hypothetical protein